MPLLQGFTSRRARRRRRGAVRENTRANAARLACAVTVRRAHSAAKPATAGTAINALLPSLTLRYAVCIGDAPALPGLTLLDWREPAAAHAATWQADRLVSMTLTSGSSGLPKAAVHTAFAHLESARGVLSLIPFHAADCWLLSLPLFHVSGQGIFWRWLRAGAQLAVRDSLPLYEALEGCTHASLVPTQLWRLLTMPERRLSLKAVLLGGAAIPGCADASGGTAGDREGRAEPDPVSCCRLWLLSLPLFHVSGQGFLALAACRRAAGGT